MDPITATYRADRSVALRGVLACHRRSLLILATIVAVDGLLGVQRGSLRPVLIGVATVLVFGVLLLRAVGAFKPSYDITITITEDEYRTQMPGVATARRWETVRQVAVTSGFWTLRLHPAGTVGFPVAAFDADQTAAFEAVLARHGLWTPRSHDAAAPSPR